MKEMAASAWAQARNILCLRLDGIGDLIMTAPAIAALKREKPDRRITLLTSRVGAEAAALISEIDDVIVYEAPWVKASRATSSSDDDSEIISRISKAGFDGAVIFTVYSQNPLPAALLCYLSEIPLRLAHCHENPYQLLTDWVPDPEPATILRHEVERQLDLVRSIGCDPRDSTIALKIDENAHRRAHMLLDDIGIDRRHPWAVVHPGATAEARRYPSAGYAKAIGILVRQHGWRMILTGTQSEGAIIESVRAQTSAPAASLAGRLNIGELAALLQQAPILISNNTAPVHIASAVGTPVVCLYALTNPQHMPWRVPSRVLYHDVPCRFCYKSTCPEQHHNCLRLVEPESIAAAAVALLAETDPTRPVKQGLAEMVASRTPVASEIKAGRR